jgi:hypothetical protein
MTFIDVDCSECRCPFSLDLDQSPSMRFSLGITSSAGQNAHPPAPYYSTPTLIPTRRRRGRGLRGANESFSEGEIAIGSRRQVGGKMSWIPIFVWLLCVYCTDDENRCCVVICDRAGPTTQHVGNVDSNCSILPLPSLTSLRFSAP